MYSSSTATQDWVMDSRLSLQDSPSLPFRPSPSENAAHDMLSSSGTSQHDSPGMHLGHASASTSAGDEVMEGYSFQPGSPDIVFSHHQPRMPSQQYSPGMSSVDSAPEIVPSQPEMPGTPFGMQIELMPSQPESPGRSSQAQSPVISGKRNSNGWKRVFRLPSSFRNRQAKPMRSSSQKLVIDLPHPDQLSRSRSAGSTLPATLASPGHQQDLAPDPLGEEGLDFAAVAELRDTHLGIQSQQQALGSNQVSSGKKVSWSPALKPEYMPVPALDASMEDQDPQSPEAPASGHEAEQSSFRRPADMSKDILSMADTRIEQQLLSLFIEKQLAEGPPDLLHAWPSLQSHPAAVAVRSLTRGTCCSDIWGRVLR